MASEFNGGLWIASEADSPMAQFRIAFEPSWGNQRAWTGTSDGRRTNGDNNTIGDDLPMLTFSAGEHRLLALIWEHYYSGGGFGEAT